MSQHIVAAVRARLAIAGKNLRETFWSPSGRAFGLAILLAWLAAGFAAVDGYRYGLHESGWTWTSAFVLMVAAVVTSSLSGIRETRERLLREYKHDLEAAAVVCNAAGCFLGDPHRSSPAAESAKMLATRLRLLKQELETRSIGTHGGGPK